MTFTEQVTATLIGTFGGFVGSLALFWIRQSFQEARREKALLTNLHYEIDYNINLLKTYEDEITRCIQAVGADSREVYLTIDYALIARYFSIQFYREGLISRHLHPDDVSKWNGFLATFCEGGETYVSETVEKWRKQEVTKEQAFKALEHEVNRVRYARKLSEYLKDKIKS
jgi:hypothetical protein